ncbi:MAG: SBBP repeat-containing protein [Bacteroidetes bacterium]|nr:SBBP repeat-containing protein [Bacteroidota bacterium]
MSKLNNTGTTLIFSTYLGGAAEDVANTIVLDKAGNTFIAGNTSSNDYCLTPGVFQITNEGINDVFITKLNTSGTALIYSTLLGGASIDYGLSIAIDSSGNAYITGATNSNNFDITVGAFQTTFGGGNYDTFVSKLNATGTALYYSTLIGGSDEDWGKSVAIDTLGNAFITGSTLSSNYDITPGAFQPTIAGNWDVFLTKLNPIGTILIYSTLVGGIGNEDASSIALDVLGNIYISGSTNSPDFYITQGAFQTTIAGGSDIFVSKFNSNGTSLIYSTFIGGSGNDVIGTMALDLSVNAHIAGMTSSADYPITPGAVQTIIDSFGDIFYCKLNVFGDSLKYSTFLGGSGLEWCYSVAVNQSGDAIIAGSTQSFNYDVTPGTFQNTNGGGFNDIIVTKFNLLGFTVITEVENNLFNISPNPSQGNYQIDFGNNADGLIQLEVLDMQGNLIEKQNLSNKNSTSIDLSKYVSGVYILKVISNNKQEIARLVKL